MFEILSAIVLLVVLPILLTKTTERGRFDWMHPYLRELWMGLIVVYAVAYIWSQKEALAQIHSKFGRHPVAAYVVVGSVGAFLFIALWAAIGWVLDKAETRTTEEHDQPKGDSVKITAKTTLHDLFENDFPDPAMMKARRGYVFSDKQTRKEVVITRQLYLDVAHKEKFVSFFVPSSGPNSRETRDACSFLASHYEIALELEKEILGTVSPTQGKAVVTPEELSFSGRVYIYHEDLLTVEERAKIVKQFRSHGASVVLRGPTYLLLTAAANLASAPAPPVLAPANRPRLVFDKWGQIPANHHLHSGRSYIGQVLQNGFYFINDGGPAYEVMVEKFMVGQSEAHSASVPRIGNEGFSLVWLDQPLHLQSSQSPGKWDLPAYMSLAAVHAHASSVVYGMDYCVTVKVTYRDGNDVDSRLWYRTSATLAYIPSQRRLEFRDITHEKGSLTRPS